MIPVEIANPKSSGDNETFLKASHEAGVTTLNVQNSGGMIDTALLLVGAGGNDRVEVVPVSAAPTNDTLTVDETKFPHPANTPVRVIRYDKIKVYVSTDGEDGAYGEEATIDIAYDNPDLITIYYDEDGDEAYYAEATYFNSERSWETPKSAPIPYSGISFYALKSMGSRVINLFNDKAQKVLKPNQVYEWLNEINQKLELVAIRADKNYIITPLTTQSFESGTDKYAKPDGFFHLRRMDVSYTTDTPESSFKKATRTQINTGDPTDTYSTENPKYYDEGANWVFKPTPTAGGYRAWYIPIPAVLENPADEPRDFLKPYTQIYINYCMMRAYQKYRMLNDANSYNNLVRQDLVDLIIDMKDLGLDEPQKMEITNTSDIEALIDEVI